MARTTLLLGIALGTFMTAHHAHAQTVERSTESGSCTVSNDDQDFVSCACTDGSDTGGTGGTDWADLSENDLLQICELELAFCEATDGTTGCGWGGCGSGSDGESDDGWGTDGGDGGTGGDGWGIDGGDGGDGGDATGASGAGGDSGGGTDGKFDDVEGETSTDDSKGCHIAASAPALPTIGLLLAGLFSRWRRQASR